MEECGLEESETTLQSVNANSWDRGDFLPHKRHVFQIAYGE